MVIRRVIELLTPLECLGCGADGGVLCADCRHKASLTGASSDGITVAAYYDGPVKDLIWRLKFHRLWAAAEAGAELILARLPRDLAVEVITAVPVAPDRYRERGYNQSELLAKAVARRLSLPYRPLLGRMTSSHQTGLGRQERLEQIRGAFFALRRIDGQRILLIDDVITTGATLAEAGDELLEAGAVSVWSAVVARH